MRPEGRAWRKRGRRADRRAQEHVLDEQRERKSAHWHNGQWHYNNYHCNWPPEARTMMHSRRILNDTITPGLAWLIDRFPDSDAGPEYLIVRVTPLRGWISFPQAAHGTTMLRQVLTESDGTTTHLLDIEQMGDGTDIVMDLIAQAREAMDGLELSDGTALTRADFPAEGRGWTWEASHWRHWQTTPRHTFNGP